MALGSRGIRSLWKGSFLPSWAGIKLPLWAAEGRQTALISARSWQQEGGALAQPGATVWMTGCGAVPCPHSVPQEPLLRTFLDIAGEDSSSA